jgi:TolB-like protein/DNA-binding winged helix-turn-helix (wHTH) protein/Tfp pilus assembly protein PilF
MGEKQTYVFEFGEYRLDPAECRLLRDGEIIPLTPKALELLCALVENGGRLMEKNRLIEMLWADAFVEEGNLADNISKIRQALGDNRKAPKFIETISGRGYRFIADVEAIEASAAQNLGAESEKTPANAVASQTRADGESRAASTDPTHNEKELPGTQVEGTSPFFLATVGNYFAPHDTRLDRQASHPPAKFDSSVNRQSTRILPLVKTSIWKQRSRSFAFAAVFIGLAGVLVFSWYATLPPLSAGTGKSIAVLPFKPLVAGDRDEALELGMSDSLISGLSRLRQITVRPISAVRRYTDLEQDARAAGRELEVESVLDGNIQRTGERIRISARLVRVEDGQTLWTETFDEKFTDIFAVQDSISQRIIGALALQLSGDERNDLIKKYTDNAEAYQLYLKGRFFWSKLTPDGLQKSLDFYSQAIEIDPDYALAYAGLADSYNLLGSYGFWPLKESHPKARAAAEKALAIDAELAEAHASLAAVIADYYWDWDMADRHFKRAIDLNPNYPVARKWYSQHLARLGRLDESVEEAKRAQTLDPLSSSANAHVGVALYRARRFDEAVAELQKALEFDPKAIDAHIFLGFVYAQQGKSAETIDEFQTVVELSERSPSLVALLGYAYATAGKRNEAQSILEEIDLRSTDGQTFPLERALIYIGLGEHDLAFEWLERAFEERAWQLGFLKVEPLYDPLRGDRRFSGLLHRLNLTP